MWYLWLAQHCMKVAPAELAQRGRERKRERHVLRRCRCCFGFAVSVVCSRLRHNLPTTILWGHRWVEFCVATFLLRNCCSPPRQLLCLIRGLLFTGRQHSRLCKPVLATIGMSVCLSVCLSHAGIVSKRRKLGPRNLHQRIVQGLVFGIKSSSRNSKGFTRSEGVKWEWGRENSQFSANNSPYLRNMQDRTKVTIND